MAACHERVVRAARRPGREISPAQKPSCNRTVQAMVPGFGLLTLGESTHVVRDSSLAPACKLRLETLVHSRTSLPRVSKGNFPCRPTRQHIKRTRSSGRRTSLGGRLTSPTLSRLPLRGVLNRVFA